MNFLQRLTSRPASRSGLAASCLLLLFFALGVLWLAGGIHSVRDGRGSHGLHGLVTGVLAGHDTLTHDYPAYWWGWRQVRETRMLPLWNPSWFCGIPFIASQTFMPFYPPNWLGAVLPFPLAFNIQYPLHLVLAALVMAWTCRARGLGWWAAAFAGLSWGFGGHLATLAGPGHIQKLQALAWLPLVTLGAWQVARGRHRGVLHLALGFALQVTAGHPQILCLSLAAGLLEALAELCRSDPAPAPLASGGGARHGFTFLRFARLLGGRAALASLAGILGLGLAAVFWIPTAEFAGLSNRGRELGWEDQTRGSLPPAEAFEFALPRLLGDSMPTGRGAYLGRYGESATSAPERVVSDYVGAATLLLALLGLLLPGRRWAAAGWLALAAAALCLSLGKYWPNFYREMLRLIPGLAYFRSPSTMMALLAYGFAMTAAVGVDSFLRLWAAGQTRRRHHLLVILLVVLLVGATALAGVAGVRVAQLGDASLAGGLDAAAMATLLRMLACRQAAHALLVAILPLLALLLLRLARRAPLRGPVVATLCLAGLFLGHLLDLSRNASPFWNSADVRPYARFLTDHWAMRRWIREEAPVRYLELGRELSNRALTLSDYPRFIEVASLQGYHPVGYARYFDLMEKLGPLHPNLLRLFAVNYLIWPADSPEKIPDGFVEVLREGGQILLHNPDNAFIRSCTHTKAVRDWPRALDRFAEPGFNVYDSMTVLNEQLAPKHRGKYGEIPNLHLQWRVIPRLPGEYQIMTTTRRQGEIIVSLPAVPGWRVKYGKSGQQGYAAASADGFFLTLPVPAGRDQLTLRYDPVSQRLGLHVTLLTLALFSFLLARALFPRHPPASIAVSAPDPA